MPNRSNSYGAGVAYRYGYIGIEKDNEISGDGNQLSTEFRQYDTRIGRWFAPDQMRTKFPSTSQYCYALNTPIAAKDENGLYTIFVNGYIYGAPNYVHPGYGGVPYYFNDDISPGKAYWDDRGSGFIKEAHDYLGDGMGRYVNGSGLWAGSTAAGRQRRGREEGKTMAAKIIADINKLNSDLNDKNDVKELNFVTHSMGAAYAEGMIEEFMKHDELKRLLEKGQIIHLSACDGDKIVIPESSKGLNRKQLNIMYDKTLGKADYGARKTGGYNIKGVSNMGVIDESIQSLHPDKNPDKYDPHFDTKSMPEIWDYMRALDKQFAKDKNGGGIHFMKKGDADKSKKTKSSPKLTPKPTQGKRKC